MRYSFDVLAADRQMAPSLSIGNPDFLKNTTESDALRLLESFEGLARANMFE